MKKALALSLTLSLAACASTGNRKILDAATVSEVKPGVAMEDVRRLLGAPQRVSMENGDTTLWEYQHTAAKADPIMFVPVVGLFGKVRTQQKQVLVRFGPDSRVTRVVVGQNEDEYRQVP